MFLQYKLNPPPPDPVQAKVFQFMPLVFSVMFALFPAGLVLYWVTNTGLSILQQWNINRTVESEGKKRKANRRAGTAAPDVRRFRAPTGVDSHARQEAAHA